jgi:hypothetical protein
LKANDTCLYPKGRGLAYTKTKHCFAVEDLIKVDDKCPKARYEVTDCRLVGGSAQGKTTCTITPQGAKPPSLCVSLQSIDRKVPRSIAATIRRTDADGRTADVDATITIYKSFPSKGANAACKRV